MSQHTFSSFAFGIISICLLTATSVQGQETTLRGTLMDRESRSPIPYASLTPLGQSERGVLSNVDGVFSLTWENNTSDTLIIRHLNYGQVRIGGGTELSDTIWLQPVPIELGEVAIFSGPPQYLWTQVLEHLDQNHYHQKVTYSADSRSMFYSPNRQELYYLSQSKADLYCRKEKRFPKVDRVKMTRQTLSEIGEKLEAGRSRVMHEVPAASFFKVFSPAFKKSAVKEFDIEIKRSFVQNGKEIAEVYLVSQESEAGRRGVFLIDLETYGILSAKYEFPGKSGNACWYQLAFTEINGKYYMTYIDHRYTSDAFMDQVYFHHIIASLKVLERTPSEDAISFLKLCFEPFSDYAITWDDPSWESGAFIPWPNWVTEKL